MPPGVRPPPSHPLHGSAKGWGQDYHVSCLSTAASSSSSSTTATWPLIEKHSEDLSLCREAVCRVTNASLVGSAMLSDKLAQLESRDYSVKVDELIDKMSKLPKVSGADLKKTLQQCADEAQNVWYSCSRASRKSDQSGFSWVALCK